MALKESLGKVKEEHTGLRNCRNWFGTALTLSIVGYVIYLMTL